MAVLLRDLPGSACDFSGSASFISRMKGMCVIHAPTGCLGNYTGFDEPEWFTRPGMVFTSSMREDEAIFGLDDILIQKSVKTVRALDPDFFVVLGAPPPALIGTDYEAISSAVENETGVPCIAVDTTGFGSYRVGAEKFLSAMADRFLNKCQTVKGTVNILGYSYLDYCNERDMDELCGILSREWGHINRCDSLDAFVRLPEAEMNLVVSSSGLKLARWMEDEFGIPYSCDLPMGDGVGDISGSGGRKVLIIGDQIISNSLRKLVESRYGCECDVSSFFGIDQSVSAEGDRALVTESDLRDRLSCGYDVVIADPLFRKFTDSDFVSLPQVAVSSRLFWNDHIPTFGRGLVSLLDRTFV